MMKLSVAVVLAVITDNCKLLPEMPWSVQNYLNNELLSFDITHKEDEALLPHWIFRRIGNLWKEKTVPGNY